MHNLFLGLIREHFDILGIRMDDDDDDDVVLDVFFPEEVTTDLNPKEQKSMKRLTKILKRRMNSELKKATSYTFHLDKLKNIHLKTLKAACNCLGAQLLPFEHAKKTKIFKIDYAKALLQWVSL